VDLSIIIVNYNVKEFIQNLLESIKSASLNLKTEIIVVDNASDDGSIELIKQKYPYVHLIENHRNDGFSKANNLGLKVAKGKYLLLLNPDTLVKEDTFEKMISFFEATPEAGMAGCKLLNTDGTLQLACRRGFPGPWASFTKVTGLSTLFPKSPLFARYNLTYLDENNTYAVDAISGAFMMIRREVYEKIGGHDETFFMYGEDLDLCYRVNKAGYKVYYVPDSLVLHKESMSTGKQSPLKTYYITRNRFLFARRNIQGFKKMVTLMYLSFFAFPKGVVSFLFDKRPDLALATMKAYFWNFIHFSDIRRNQLLK